MSEEIIEEAVQRTKRYMESRKDIGDTDIKEYQPETGELRTLYKNATGAEDCRYYAVGYCGSCLAFGMYGHVVYALQTKYRENLSINAILWRETGDEKRFKNILVEDVKYISVIRWYVVVEGIHKIITRELVI